ncbi:kinase-like domain [Cordyceps militaris]|uniref:Kinase-like domain n=1 Tax=Cordyceps militaris TaxID=73501 RepID=A0A2H4SMZ1_CORMI|nr:kinase-like domain [Cordyceps militaris]
MASAPAASPSLTSVAVPPPSPEQPWDLCHLQTRVLKLRNAIDLDKVKELASQHNEGKFCRISHDIVVGKTFLCIAVTFPNDGQEWVVRIATKSTVDREWDMIRSEVATIRYIQRYTSIPVPTVHAYGTGKHLTDDLYETHSYIIQDRVPGKALGSDALALMTREKRKRVWCQLADALAQLQELTFPTTGSLYPDESDDMKQCIGPALSRWDEYLSNRDGVTRSRPVFTTAWDSIQHHLAVLKDGPEMRQIYCQTEPNEVVPQQIFAMDAVARHVNDENALFWRENAGFRLSKGRFASNNIFVDSEGNIQGIINWAWTEILPRQLCQPMNWVRDVGLSPERRREDGVWEEFLEVVKPDHAYHEHLRYYTDNEAHTFFAAILRYPDSLTTVYFWDLFYNTQHEEADYVLLGGFFSQPEHKARLDRLLAVQKRHSDEVSSRLASHISSVLLPQWRLWHNEMGSLVFIASEARHFLRDAVLARPPPSLSPNGPDTGLPHSPV